MSMFSGIRPALTDELPQVLAVRNASILSGNKEAGTRPELQSRADHIPLHLNENLIEDGCLLVAGVDGVLTGTIALDLQSETLRGLHVLPEARGSNVANGLLDAAEELAAQFGVSQLSFAVPAGLASFYGSRGFYEQAPGDRAITPAQDGPPDILMCRDISDRQTGYGRWVMSLMKELGIPANYGSSHRLRFQEEATDLESIGFDIYQREQQLLPDAAQAWRSMQSAAALDQVDVKLVSAFRSVEYQTGIIRRKLEKGLAMPEILAASAAPGFSEHHGGRAMDLAAPGYPVLEEEFELSPAFDWLTQRAGEFGYSLSYPRRNRHGILYEPWHWCYLPAA